MDPKNTAGLDAAPTPAKKKNKVPPTVGYAPCPMKFCRATRIAFAEEQSGEAALLWKCNAGADPEGRGCGSHGRLGATASENLKREFTAAAARPKETPVELRTADHPKPAPDSAAGSGSTGAGAAAVAVERPAAKPRPGNKFALID
ncbi:MAG TPA: hypothetical protein VNE82_03470 [Candidatus Binataceae bacterium]|nr:hypothetical protein [Candidatus Binataceae bacterium]